MNSTDFELFTVDTANQYRQNKEHESYLGQKQFEIGFIDGAKWSRRETIAELKKAGLWAAVDYLERDRNMEGKIYDPHRL